MRGGAGYRQAADHLGTTIVATEQEMAMALGDEVDEMNQLLMGLATAAQRSFQLLANRIENLEKA